MQRLFFLSDRSRRTEGLAPDSGEVTAMKPRILLAEPDRVLRASYRHCLMRAGYRVESARDTGSCVDRIKQLHPALLVLDLDGPWDADDILERIEEDLLATPVLILSERPDE